LAIDLGYSCEYNEETYLRFGCGFGHLHVWLVESCHSADNNSVEVNSSSVDTDWLDQNNHHLTDLVNLKPFIVEDSANWHEATFDRS
jgi:hypothetical protein